VAEVLRSGRVNYWTGDEGKAFEQEFAAHCGVEYGLALANGTVALELAMAALGIGPGDEVVVTPRSFMASASTVVLRGARAVFAEVDRDTQNITADTIAPLINERTRAIIPVHLAGLPCDMDPIMDLAASHGLFVIEDCAQAHGATYKGRPVGGIGHAGAFSFCQDKIMTTGGEGGLLVTDDEAVWRRAWAYKDHGKSHRTVYEVEHKPGFRYLHESMGTNWRLTEMQAVLGRRQLARLPEWHARRAANAAILAAGLRGIPGLRVPPVPDWAGHAWYKFYAFVEPDRLKEGWDRFRVKETISAEGIPCYSGSCPEIYLEKAFVAAGMGPAERLPVARELGETSLMFLVHPTLADADMADAVQATRKVMAAAVR
jgi:dTDP-4-amino-4,6-dideoxygalactose transaminase